MPRYGETNLSLRQFVCPRTNLIQTTLTKTMAGKVRPRVGALAVLALIGACGWGPSGSTASTASTARTASPNTTLQPPDAERLTGTNCSGPAANTAPRLLGQYYTIRPAPNWTDTGDYTHDEFPLLELTAPGAYGFAPTRLEFGSGAVGPVHTIYGPGATAHSIAQVHATSIAQETSPHAVAGTVRDCSVAGDAAAAYGFDNGAISGFYIYFIHNDGLDEVFLEGMGGLGDQAIQDALGMIGSVVWAS